MVLPQAISGYAAILSAPDDVRLLIKPVTSVKRLLTLCHETGHALSHACNKQSGIFGTWTVAHDETMAIVLEHVATERLMEDPLSSYSRQIMVLETARCSLSGLFELALWEQPNRAEELYMEHYGRIGLEPMSPALWVLDSFRTIDPVYIHSYVLGDCIARDTVAFLLERYGKDLPRWGSWLRQNYYADGRCRSLAEKTAVLRRSTPTGPVA